MSDVCEFCGFGLVMAGLRRCCNAGLAVDTALAERDSLRSHANALATAISQYLEALSKPDHTALTTRHLYSALKDYQDFMGTEKQDK